jgi:hypothetical protein
VVSHDRIEHKCELGRVVADAESRSPFVRCAGVHPECLKEIELKGNYFGEFSLSVVVYDRNLAACNPPSRHFTLNCDLRGAWFSLTNSGVLTTVRLLISEVRNGIHKNCLPGAGFALFNA